jgi:hypothetical protein
MVHFVGFYYENIVCINLLTFVRIDGLMNRCICYICMMNAKTAMKVSGYFCNFMDGNKLK